MNYLNRRDFIKAVGITALASMTYNCSSSSVWQPDYSQTISEVKEFIIKKMTEDAVPGVSIALVDGDRTIWSDGFGVCEAKSNRLVDANTIFEIGSISKTFTGFMVMQLVGQGKIDLDDPITKHIKSFQMKPPMGKYPTTEGVITIRSMMTHHSGIPGDMLNGGFAMVYYPDYNSRLLNLLSQTNATAPVNFKGNYSNTAISLLADVIESASGESFRMLSDRFIKEVGMSDASFFRDGISQVEKIARGHWLGEAVGPIYVNVPASGSILSSVLDMAEYLKMVIAKGRVGSRQIIREDLFDEMMTRQNNNVALDYDTSLGLIWMLSDSAIQGAGRVRWHNGSTNTFNSHLEILADYGLGVVVLANSDNAGSLVADAAKLALKSAFKAKTSREVIIPKPEYSPIVTRTKAELEAIAGIYVSGDGYIKVSALENALEITSIKSSGVGTKIMVPRANGYFSLSDNQDIQYAFPFVTGRRIISTLSSNHRSALAERFDLVTIPESWNARCGNYKMINIDPNDAFYIIVGEDYLQARLYIEQDLLIFAFHEKLYVLEPLNDTMCLMRGFGRGQGSTVRVVTTGQKESLWYFDMQFEKTA